MVPFDGKETAVTNAVGQVLAQYTTNVTVLSYTVGAPVPYGPSAAPAGSPQVSTSSSGVRRSMLATDSRCSFESNASVRQLPPSPALGPGRDSHLEPCHCPTNRRYGPITDVASHAVLLLGEATRRRLDGRESCWSARVRWWSTCRSTPRRRTSSPPSA